MDSVSYIRVRPTKEISPRIFAPAETAEEARQWSVYKIFDTTVEDPQPWGANDTGEVWDEWVEDHSSAEEAVLHAHRLASELNVGVLVEVPWSKKP